MLLFHHLFLQNNIGSDVHPKRKLHQVPPSGMPPRPLLPHMTNMKLTQHQLDLMPMPRAPRAASDPCTPLLRLTLKLTSNGEFDMSLEFNTENRPPCQEKNKSSNYQPLSIIIPTDENVVLKYGAKKILSCVQLQEEIFKLFKTKQKNCYDYYVTLACLSNLVLCTFVTAFIAEEENKKDKILNKLCYSIVHSC